MRPRIDGSVAGRLDALLRDEETYAALLNRLLDGDVDYSSLSDASQDDELRPRIDDDTAARLRSEQRTGETISETVDRLIARPIADLAERSGETPTAREYQSDDETPPISAFHGGYGSWNAALAAAGFEPTFTPKGPFTKEELIDDMLAFADELGHAPSSTEMMEDGPHSTSTYIEHFDGWAAAKEAAGLSSGGIECPGCGREFSGASDLRDHLDECDEASHEAVA